MQEAVAAGVVIAIVAFWGGYFLAISRGAKTATRKNLRR
jgi:hypothetical protein